jgi:hypothetical protein
MKKIRKIKAAVIPQLTNHPGGLPFELRPIADPKFGSLSAS